MIKKCEPLLPDEVYKQYPDKVVALGGPEKQEVLAAADTLEELLSKVEGWNPGTYVVMQLPPA